MNITSLGTTGQNTYSLQTARAAYAKQTVRTPETQQTKRAMTPQRFGQSFVNANPAPDGVRMMLSAQGRALSELQKKQGAQQGANDTDKAAVTRKLSDEKDSAQKKDALPRLYGPDGRVTKTNAQKTENNVPKERETSAVAKPSEAKPQEEKAVEEKADTTNLSRYNKSELRDLFLNGDISLKKYQDEIRSREMAVAAAPALSET